MKNLFYILVSGVMSFAIVASVFAEGFVFSNFSTIKNEYHKNMNDLFNERLDKLVDMMEDDEVFLFDNPNFIAPESKEECDEENVSTFCLSMDATDRYVNHYDSLRNLRNTLPTNPFVSDTKRKDMQVAYAIRNNEIDQEIEDAKLVMDRALGVYNEFILAYMMHKEYADVADSLVKYKIRLEELKKEVAEFPGRFIDASSAQCK